MGSSVVKNGYVDLYTVQHTYKTVDVFGYLKKDPISKNQFNRES